MCWAYRSSDQALVTSVYTILYRPSDLPFPYSMGYFLEKFVTWFIDDGLHLE